MTTGHSTQPKLRVKGATKVYNTRSGDLLAIDRCSLDIMDGEIVSIVGPSGCGKTTLLSILGLLDSPSEGSYVLAGEPVATLSAAQRARVRSRAIGFIFQAFNLIGDLDVYSNVELPLKYRGLSPAERRGLVHEALERVGLLHRIHHFPAQLSGGQQQRVAVARAVVGKPLVLLADEPTGNLDSKTGNEIMGVFERLHAAGNTIVLVTHEADIAAYAHRVIHIRDGQVEKDVKRAA
jgi:putative ABC transport system ATP-binding protein